MLLEKLLVDARALIALPTQWCQLASARDSFGKSVGVNLPSACRFCIAGAVHLAILRNRTVPPSSSLDYSVESRWLTMEEHQIANTAHQLLTKVANAIYPSRENPGCMWLYPAGFNDAPSRMHVDVLSTFDRAIEEAKA